MTNSHAIIIEHPYVIDMDAELTVQSDYIPETTESGGGDAQSVGSLDSSLVGSLDNSLVKECVICYEPLSSTKNMCITECGHEFCFSCMMKHVQVNNGCPCCRSVIIEDLEDSDAEDEDDDDDETLNSEDDEDEPRYHLERFEEMFISKGYGLKEALSLLVYNFSQTDAKYTKEYVARLEADVDEMVDGLQTEFEREQTEREEMAAEDPTRDEETEDEGESV